MKHYLHYLFLLFALIFAGGGFAGCSDDETEEVDPTPVDPTPAETEYSAVLTVGNVDANSAVLTLETENIAEYAYVLEPAAAAEEPTYVVLFATGTVAECTDGENVFTVSGLDPNTDYVVYAAVRQTDGEPYGEILSASFTTGDYTDTITFLGVAYDGFSVHVKVPEETKERGNVLRYTKSSLPMYNLVTQLYGNLDADCLEANGQRYIEDALTIIYDEYHAYNRDENGEILYDDYGDPDMAYDIVTPGEPSVFLVGEFTWGESIYGWGEGWYTAMFDYDTYYDEVGGGWMPWSRSVTRTAEEDPYWTGYFSRHSVVSTEPERLAGTVEVDVTDITTNTATLRFTPDDDVQFYCVLLLDYATYEGMVLPLLDGREEYMQWFTASYFASMQLGVQVLSGPVEMDMSEYFAMDADSTYEIFVTGMGDDFGYSQCFTHKSFTTAQKSLPAPVIEVKGISNPDGEDSPYEVWFNVKAPNRDVMTASYVCNYERDWASMLSQGYTYAMMCEYYGNGLSGQEVAQINTSDGLNLCFPTREDAVSRLAVIGWNEEYTPNDLSDGSASIADNRSVRQPDAERVESPLFAELTGDWTATATLATYDYYADTDLYPDRFVPLEDPVSCKVTISAGVDYPAAVAEEDYDVYLQSGKTKAEVDALYEDLKEVADIFNAKVRGQNRLLCTGFGFEQGSSNLAYASPYDLFVSPTYSGYNNEAVLFDFGPKWYLQIDADGTVTAPINMTRQYPLTAWTSTSTQRYLVGVGPSANIAYDPTSTGERDASFSVAVSDDGNTLTISPIEYGGSLYYPNACAVYSSGYLMSPTYKVVSEITLTRGWNEASAASRVAPSARMRSGVTAPMLPSVDGRSLSPSVRPSLRSNFKVGSPVRYERVESIRPVDAERFKAGSEKIVEKYLKRK